MTAMSRMRRIEVLADEPLIPALERLAANAGIHNYTLLPTLGGMGQHGRWRDDQVSGATAKIMLLAITAPEKAEHFVDLISPLLEPHRLLLLLGDVDVVRGPQFE
jgi:hypothetical protein